MRYLHCSQSALRKLLSTVVNSSNNNSPLKHIISNSSSRHSNNNNNIFIKNVHKLQLQQNHLQIAQQQQPTTIQQHRLYFNSSNIITTIFNIKFNKNYCNSSSNNNKIIKKLSLDHNHQKLYRIFNIITLFIN